MEIFLHPSSSSLFKNLNAYLFLYFVDGESGFLDLILFLVRKPFTVPKPRPSFHARGWHAYESCSQSRSYRKGQKFNIA